jgi:putative nucleotidyltransferase with HDIG domain
MSADKKLRILFVDDEPMILDVIQLTLESMASEWEMVFVESGAQALELMARHPFDIIVTDMRMPDMTGAQLLIEVMKRYPATVRIILSAYAEQDLLLKCVGATHQYLAKPLEMEALKTALSRVASLKAWLPSRQIQQSLIREEFLPSIPAVYLEIIEALQTPNCDIQAIGELVATDPGLTAKLLQLANSAFLGFAREVSSAEEAVMLFGIGTVRSLALSAPVFSSFQTLQVEGFSLEEVWNHSLRVGRMAQTIATLEGASEEVLEQTFTAGVLHDIGKVLLAENPAVDYSGVIARARQTGRPLFEVERDVFQVTHAQVGAFLLDLWGLPPTLVEAVALHHTPAETNEPVFNPLTAVYVGNSLEHDAETPNHEQLANRLDPGYIRQIGLEHRIEAWQEELTAA